MAKYDENLAGVLVDGHRKITSGTKGGPARGLPSLCAIYDGNRSRVRDVNEDPFGMAIELKALRMALQLDLTDLLTICGIDHGEAAATVADKNLMVCGTDPNVVRILSELDAAG